MNIHDKIINRLKSNKVVTVQEIVGITGYTRQAVHKHFRKLMSEGVIKKIGRTRGVKYVLNKNPAKSVLIKAFRDYKLKNLEEDRTFSRLNMEYSLNRILKKNVFEIFEFAFTEILNNAIDHSKSKTTRVSIHSDNYNITFRIDDWGIGIFKNIMDKFRLQDEYEAMQELIKGKITTFKDRHSGEGLFFTSKAADNLYIRSHRIGLLFDNQKKDVMAGENRFKKGTAVEFTIKTNSKRELGSVFDKYSGEEYNYKFNKTKVSVKLFTELKDFYASRSEARRLLYNLKKYEHIILDFKGVKGISRAFTDEIFRVFKSKYPGIKLEPVNTNKTVQAMINHVDTCK